MGDAAEKASSKGDKIAIISWKNLAYTKEVHEKVAYKQQDPMPKAIASIWMEVCLVDLSL